MIKEEIKDELYRMLSDVVNGGYPIRNNTQKGRYREAVKEAIKALEQEPRWISVSERLPTKEEYIDNNGLFIVSDGNRTYAEYFDVYNSMKYFGEPTMNGFRVDRCVTSWMPLPKPYKAKSEDKMSNLEKAKEIVKACYKFARCGIYNSRNTAGDRMETIYESEGLTIDVCHSWSYFEVFGLSDAEFEELEKYYHSLEESEDKE